MSLNGIAQFRPVDARRTFKCDQCGYNAFEFDSLRSMIVCSYCSAVVMMKTVASQSPNPELVAEVSDPVRQVVICGKLE